MASFLPTDPFPGAVVPQSLPPVERRRQRARDQLREASEIAFLLSASDENPSLSVSAREHGCSCCQTPLEWEALDALRTMILSQDNLGSIRRDIEERLRVCPDATRFLTPLVTQQSETRKKKGKNDSLCIHLAASVGNLEAFEALYYADPDCVDLANGNGKTALHLAVLGGHLDMTRMICNRSPQCCSMLDFEGNLPLHLAVGDSSLRNQNAHLITSSVLAAYPRGMTVRNDEGVLPIHVATKSGFAPGIRALMTANTATIYERTNVANGALLSVDLALMEHMRVIQQLRASRENANQIRSSQTESGERRETNTTRLDNLDSINRKSAYEECIEVLLMSALYFRPVFMPREESHEGGGDTRFFLPLHAALVSPLATENWNHLFEMYGKIHASDVDRDGRTLLHAIAASCDKPESGLWSECYSDNDLVTMIKQVHGMSPTLYAMADQYGLIPLHLGILRSASANVIQALIDCGRETTRAVWIS